MQFGDESRCAVQNDEMTHNAPKIVYGRASSWSVVVWLSGCNVGLINEVTLRPAGLVLRWVTVRGYTVSASNQATRDNSAWPSLHGRRYEYRQWLRPPLGKKQRVLHSSRPCYHRTAAVLSREGITTATYLLIYLVSAKSFPGS